MHNLKTLRAIGMVEDDKINKNLVLSAWLEATSPRVKALLCAMAGTSESMFRQWVSKRRNLSAEKAGDIEDAMVQLNRDYPGEAPPALTRADLCDACRKCPYYQAVEEAADADFFNK